ncbi:MAG: protein kinase domain-containing protein, partial [Gemmatimonadales bacterium]
MGVPDGLREALADRYAIERELGRGGMAVVYLAQDLRHERPVALKLLLPELAASLGPDRFQREIRFAARLQHPHILTVLDSGEATGRLWFTMPFVEGESLRDRLRRERQLPVHDALRIADEAARALDYAHQHGVVHRDIKPENILLAKDGSTLVADFGIARALGGVDEGLTQTGFAVGTPAYMSPEQSAGDKGLDPRTDLYSLASVLYEMLAGEPPFTGATAQAIAVRRLTEAAPSVRTLRPTVPAGVDEAIRRALAPVPADRFATAGHFAHALQASAPSGTASAATVPSPATMPSPAVAPPPAAETVPSQVAESARAAPSAAPVPSARRQVPVAAIALTAGLLIGGGLLFAWRHNGAGTEPAGGTRIVAVLPFDNLGDSADAYFADGVSDEVRTRLGKVGSIEVIARGSSLEYRHSSKRPSEIAHELGADYLLTGTVRWEKSGGTSRVRVAPELVDARPGQPARSKWSEQFDASLTDVFQVQGDIATKVADALGVALADSARREVTAKPTENLEAYDEFLKGEAASQAMTVNDPPSLRRAIDFYQHAVALDSTFAVAWAELSRARTRLYQNSIPDPSLGEQARLAAERALQLKPNEPLVHRALGAYYVSVSPTDLDRGIAEYQEVVRLAPNDVGLLGALASREEAKGQWDSAAARTARAAQLDPRSAQGALNLADVRTQLRQYAAADSAADHALALAPTNLIAPWQKVLNTLARGDLDSARSVIRAAARQIDPGVLLLYFATYQDLYWVLDDAQQRQVLASPLSAFDNDPANRSIVLTQIYHLRGDRNRTAIYADSARIAFAEQSRAAPADAQRHVFLGLSLAYLGRKAEAVQEGLRGVELLPVSRDALTGPYIQLQLVRIYLLVGEPEKALDQLEPLLKRPYYLSPGWLRIDPTFDPIRNQPRFKKLVEG